MFGNWVGETLFMEPQVGEWGRREEEVGLWQALSPEGLGLRWEK